MDGTHNDAFQQKYNHQVNNSNCFNFKIDRVVLEFYTVTKSCKLFTEIYQLTF